MTLPERIQLRRVKGWRMPPNTVNCARPNRYGNDFRVGEDYSFYLPGAEKATAAQCAELHRRFLEAAIEADPQAAELMRKRLRGKNLACWCKIGEPCHADVLLELANA